MNQAQLVLLSQPHLKSKHTLSAQIALRSFGANRKLESIHEQKWTIFEQLCNTFELEGEMLRLLREHTPLYKKAWKKSNNSLMETTQTFNIWTHFYQFNTGQVPYSDYHCFQNLNLGINFLSIFSNYQLHIHNVSRDKWELGLWRVGLRSIELESNPLSPFLELSSLWGRPPCSFPAVLSGEL